MSTWKRDAASGLAVLVPIIVTLWVVYWLYTKIADLPILKKPIADPVLRVALTLAIFTLLVFAMGYLMRTALGSVVERVIDDVMNRVPVLRVIYNASKMGVETALTGTEDLQAPVKLETWNGLRMTGFKTGKTTDDGRVLVFLPTSPNITTGFVVEVEPENLTETNERVEDALTRVLSAGFGEGNDRSDRGVPIDVVDGTADGGAEGGASDGTAADGGSTQGDEPAGNRESTGDEPPNDGESTGDEPTTDR